MHQFPAGILAMNLPVLLKWNSIESMASVILVLDTPTCELVPIKFTFQKEAQPFSHKENGRCQHAI